MPWRNFLSPEVRTKFQREVPLFLEITEFPFNTVQDWWKEAHNSQALTCACVVLKYSFGQKCFVRGGLVLGQAIQKSGVVWSL